MRWTMIPGALFLAVLFFGGDKLFIGKSSWWPILIAGFILVHFWAMVRGHRAPNHERDDSENEAVDHGDATRNGRREHEGEKPK